MDACRDRWLDLMRRLAAASDPAVDAAFSLVDAAYRVPLRAYHDLSHVSACLALLDDARGAFEFPAIAEYAIWLHDAIYDPARADNEQRSAAAARILGMGLGIAEAALDAVESMILATRHAGPAETRDAALVADIDLAILAADADGYRAYARAIRAEYAVYDDAEFAAGRTRFLKAMLERERIYQTSLFHGRFEAAARRNLADEIAEWAT